MLELCDSPTLLELSLSSSPAAAAAAVAAAAALVEVAEARDDADDVAGTMAGEEAAAPSVTAGGGFCGRFNFLDFHSSLR